MSTQVDKVMSFADIVQGRDASVRVTEDGMVYVVDLAMVVTGADMKCCNQTLRRLPPETFCPTKIVERNLSSINGKATRLVSFSDAIELVMVLPGKVAKETRAQFKSIIERYMAGDATLVDEIRANAACSSPIRDMARESLKRRREEAEVIKLEMENNKARLDFFLETMEILDPDWKKDTRLLLQTKDLVKSATFLSVKEITNGEKSINIGDVALEEGYGKLNHKDSCAVGKRLAKLYRDRHDASPPQREQFVDGVVRKVNDYTEQDRDLLVEALSILDE